MAFTDQKPRVVSEEELKANWNGRGRAAFRCYVCGHRFELGDGWRWQYVEGDRNLMVCSACDGPDLLERWAARMAWLRQSAWWLFDEAREG
jgi:hypothetical protein